MKKLSSTLLLLALLLGACSGGSTSTESAATQKPASADAGINTLAATESIAIETVVPAREAVISEIENNVLARMSSNEELVPASVGMSIGIGGGIETGSDSRVRINLLPDGTIIRVGPNSSFTLSSLIEENGKPKTKLELLFGQVFILLNGGSLDVETLSGVASVRGSLMSVTYSPGQNHMITTCLEGHCQLKDDDEELELIEGQAADLIDGDLEDELRDMTFEELGLWILDNPDLEEYIEEFPDLPDLPEDFDWNYDFNSNPEFEFFFDPEYNPGDQFFDPTFEPIDPTFEPIDPTLEPIDIEPGLPDPGE